MLSPNSINLQYLFVFRSSCIAIKLHNTVQIYIELEFLLFFLYFKGIILGFLFNMMFIII